MHGVMPMTFLRVALVGCGLISETHIRAYKHHANRARITVCCDLDPEKAAQRAELAVGARAVTSLDEVLADPDVDSIEICTPHHLHADIAIAAARAGKHILCQKPLAKTMAECDAMIAAAKAAGVILYYGETNHTMPAALEMQRAIEQGRIGRLIGVQATYAHWQGGKYLSTAWRYDPRVTGGGQLLDGGIHYVDLMLRMGGPIQSVTCFTTRFRPELGGEDTAVVNVRFDSGHLGTLFSSQATGIWFPGTSFVAFGTEGVLTIGGPDGMLTLHRPDLPSQREVLLEAPEDSFAVMIGRYLDTALNGAPNPSPGEVGRENLGVVLAAYESARLGRAVRLDEIRPDRA
jgi:predicted dehydrogenase